VTSKKFLFEFPKTHMDELKHGDLLVTIHGWWRFRKGTKFRYRQGPVPGTSKWRGGGGCFRHPRTTQELGSGYIADDEDLTTLTASQVHKITRVRDLPSAWDDIIRGDIRKHSSWKRHRNTQYYPGASAAP